MGVIAKQSIRNLFSSYIGFLIGGFYTAILVPKIFANTLDEWGTAKLLLSYAMIMMPWVQLSFPSVIVKFFPNQNSKENSKLLFLIVFWLTITLSISTLLIIYYPNIFYNSHSNDLLKDNILFILPLLIGVILFETLSALSKANLNSVYPVFLKEFIHRFFFLIIIVLYGLDLINYNTFLFLFSISYLAIVIPLLIFIIQNNYLKINIDFRYIFAKNRITVYKYAFFLLLNSGAAAILINIDSIMINKYIGTAEITIYITWFFLASILLMPTRAITPIASTVISEALAKNELEIVKIIYKKTSITPFTFSLLLFLLITFNLDIIESYFGAAFAMGRDVFIFIALGNLVYTISSINGTIINLSRYYYYDIIFQTFMIITVVITNIIFIPKYGIVGAALASSLSVVLLNILRSTFVYIKFGIHPFDKSTIKILLIGILSFLGIYFIDIETNIFSNLFISVAMSSFYVFSIYKLNISEDYNNIINTALNNIIDKFKHR